MQQLLIAGRYRLLDLVGTGGMGRVWLARDEMLHRDVAVKEVVPPSWLAEAEREELRLRTLREARTAARLNHPNVVRIYDVVHDRESPWIVMEYVPSRSVQQIISAEGPLSPQRTARIGLAVLAALRAAHTAGVLHRDVKPHNVLVADDGRVVLTDFGLATFDGGEGAMTGPGTVLGSPQFVAPERAREGVSDPRTDLWSLGATLYATVEGQSPYARSSAMATLSALATEPPDPMRRAGPLRPVLTRPVAARPLAAVDRREAEPLLRQAPRRARRAGRAGRCPRRWRRCSSAGRTMTPAPVEPGPRRASRPPPTPAGRPAGRPRSRRRRLIALGGAATALLVAGGVTLALVNRDDERTPPSGSGGGAPTSRPAAFACATSPPPPATHSGGVGVAAGRGTVPAARGLDLVRRPDRLSDRRAGGLGALDRGSVTCFREIRRGPGAQRRGRAGAGRPGGVLEGRGGSTHHR